MAKFTGSDWRAIKWYMQEFKYKIRDLSVWPNVRFRDSDNKVIDVNITHIRGQYNTRPKASKGA